MVKERFGLCFLVGPVAVSGFGVLSAGADDTFGDDRYHLTGRRLVGRLYFLYLFIHVL